MDLSEYDYFQKNIDFCNLMGSDTALGNIFLLKDRYKIQIINKHNCLIRYFNYSNSIMGYTFPLLYKKKNELDRKSIYKQFFLYITNDLKDNNIPLCLFSNEQKNEFNKLLTEYFPEYIIEWKTNPADSDYIYLQSDLEKLPGKKLQKKKNHISKFYRTFDDISFLFFDKSNFSQTIRKDFLSVVYGWIDEQRDRRGEEEINIYEAEKRSIEAALDNISVFSFSGGILYIKDKAVAITLASSISDKVLDIHFEKCLSQEASFGGYAVINNLFIKECKSYKYINREEDLGIEGLKKAKLSYKPEIILEKYYGTLVRN